MSAEPTASYGAMHAVQAKAYGPGISGALFGGGWWFWVDACAASHTEVPFVQYLPGIIATLALIMINAIRRYVPVYHLLPDHSDRQLKGCTDIPDHAWYFEVLPSSRYNRRLGQDRATNCHHQAQLLQRWYTAEGDLLACAETN